MILLATIINRFRETFLQQYESFVLPAHLNALTAMAGCRQTTGPHMLAQCSDNHCGQELYIPHSCGHRSCPHCQNHESQQWIDNQLSKRLPSQYFLLTFTLPEQLRDLAWRNQRIVYSLMITSVQELLKTFTQNDKNLAGSAGFTTLLQTNTRDLEHHPHVHVVMPAASVNLKTGLWRTKSTGYLFSQKAMAKVFRAKLLQALVDHGLTVPKDCPKDWVVDCKNVGNGDKAIVYLGKYLYRGVIQEKDILSCENGMVTFRFLHAKSGEYRTRKVTGEKFLYLLMLHVLPKGFRRTRCYGFLHPCSKKLVRFLQIMLRVPGFKMVLAAKKRATIVCPLCGATMKIVKTMIPYPSLGLADCHP